MTNSTSITPVTRRVAKVVFSTIKKIGNSRGVTLKKIHDYIRDEYPNTATNIVKLNNTLEKALAFGAVDKKNNKYVLGSVIKNIIDEKGRRRTFFLTTKRPVVRTYRRGRRGRRRRSRRRRRGKGRRGRRRMPSVVRVRGVKSRS